MIMIQTFLTDYNHNLIHFSFMYNLLRRAAFSTASNPYRILGLQKGCSESEIKQAYYRLAQEYHPDKNSAPDAVKKFNQVKDAYEILQDKQKRKMYDSCGYDHEFEQQFSKKKTKNTSGKYTRARNTDDYKWIFEEFDAFFTERHGPTQRQRKQKGDDIKLNLTLTFKEGIFGLEKEVSFKKLVVCRKCKGTRSMDGYTAQKCYTCGGSGSLWYAEESRKVEVKCGNCKGYGKVVKKECQACEGEGMQLVEVREKVRIPQNVSSGQMLRKVNSGNTSLNGGANGDLIIHLSVEDDVLYSREGNNIVSTLALSVAEAMLGTTKRVETIWGKVEVVVPGLTQPDARLSIPQMGI